MKDHKMNDSEDSKVTTPHLFTFILLALKGMNGCSYVEYTLIWLCNLKW